MEDDAFPNEQAPEQAADFDLYNVDKYPFNEAKLHLPGIPPWWVKTDAKKGILIGDGVSGKHTHAYIHEPGTESFGIGAHLKDEKTGAHLYDSKPKRWFLREDVATWLKWLGNSFSGFLARIVPDLPEGMAFRSLEQLLGDDPWGRRPGWHPIHVSEMIRSFERKRGVIVVDMAGMQRMAEIMPTLSTPDILTCKKGAPHDDRMADIAFRLPVRKELLAFYLKTFLERNRQGVVLDPNDPSEFELSREAYWIASWMLKALKQARNGPLYVAFRGGMTERWMRATLDWALTGAIEAFPSKDMKEYWTALRDRVRKARKLSEIDWAQIINVDFARLFGRPSDPANEAAAKGNAG